MLNFIVLAHLLRNCCRAKELVLVSKPVMKEEKRELRTQADAEQRECESSVSVYSAVSSYKEEISRWETLLFGHQSTSYIHSVNLHKYLCNEVQQSSSS